MKEFVYKLINPIDLYRDGTKIVVNDIVINPIQAVHIYKSGFDAMSFIKTEKLYNEVNNFVQAKSFITDNTSDVLTPLYNELRNVIKSLESSIEEKNQKFNLFIWQALAEPSIFGLQETLLSDQKTGMQILKEDLFDYGKGKLSIDDYYCITELIKKKFFFPIFSKIMEQLKD